MLSNEKNNKEAKMTYENFSNKLKQLGLTREEFSKLVGMKYNSVANWKSKEIFKKKLSKERR